MTPTRNETLSRRDVLKSTAGLAAASAFTGLAVPQVFAGQDSTIQIALIGCGGRGTGAASNALSVKNGPIKLVAMADVFSDKLGSSYRSLKKEHDSQVDVPEDKKFIGFDGYKKAMDCLKPGDVAIFATPPGFRWVHFAYALQKGLNVFMEKPVTVDGPSTRKFLELADLSEKQKTKVGVGLMCRHCVARAELFDRIKAGEMGDIILMRAYRQHGPSGTSAFSPRNPGKYNDLLYQIRRFHSFLWASGGSFSDFYIHNIDECCWMKDAWPVEARASGAREYREGIENGKPIRFIDQNMDTYSVEYTFKDGSKFFFEGRTMDRVAQGFASYAHGSKGFAIISQNGHSPARCKIYKGQSTNSPLAWKFPSEEPSPYQLEWDHLIEAIRHNKPYNEARRGAQASLVTAMGRMAAHTGQVVKYDDMLKNEQEFGPNVDKLTMDSAPPVLPDKDGVYPVPEPGRKKRLEY